MFSCYCFLDQRPCFSEQTFHVHLSERYRKYLLITFLMFQRAIDNNYQVRLMKNLNLKKVRNQEPSIRDLLPSKRFSVGVVPQNMNLLTCLTLQWTGNTQTDFLVTCLNNHFLFLHKIFKQRNLKQQFLNNEKSMTKRVPQLKKRLG